MFPPRMFVQLAPGVAFPAHMLVPMVAAPPSASGSGPVPVPLPSPTAASAAISAAAMSAAMYQSQQQAAVALAAAVAPGGSASDGAAAGTTTSKPPPKKKGKAGGSAGRGGGSAARVSRGGGAGQAVAAEPGAAASDRSAAASASDVVMEPSTAAAPALPPTTEASGAASGSNAAVDTGVDGTGNVRRSGRPHRVSSRLAFDDDAHADNQSQPQRKPTSHSCARVLNAGESDDDHTDTAAHAVATTVRRQPRSASGRRGGKQQVVAVGEDDQLISGNGHSDEVAGREPASSAASNASGNPSSSSASMHDAANGDDDDEGTAAQPAAASSSVRRGSTAAKIINDGSDMSSGTDPVIGPRASKRFADHNQRSISTASALFRCASCPYTCLWQSELDRHTRTHTGARPFKCRFCPYTCSRKDNLRYHEKHKHPEDVEAADGISLAEVTAAARSRSSSVASAASGSKSARGRRARTPPALSTAASQLPAASPTSDALPMSSPNGQRPFSAQVLLQMRDVYPSMTPLGPEGDAAGDAPLSFQLGGGAGDSAAAAATAGVATIAAAVAAVGDHPTSAAPDSASPAAATKSTGKRSRSRRARRAAGRHMEGDDAEDEYEYVPRSGRRSVASSSQASTGDGGDAAHVSGSAARSARRLPLQPAALTDAAADDSDGFVVPPGYLPIYAAHPDADMDAGNGRLQAAGIRRGLATAYDSTAAAHLGSSASVLVDVLVPLATPTTRVDFFDTYETGVRATSSGSHIAGVSTSAAVDRESGSSAVGGHADGMQVDAVISKPGASNSQRADTTAAGPTSVSSRDSSASSSSAGRMTTARAAVSLSAMSGSATTAFVPAAQATGHRHGTRQSTGAILAPPTQMASAGAASGQMDGSGSSAVSAQLAASTRRPSALPPSTFSALLPLETDKSDSGDLVGYRPTAGSASQGPRTLGLPSIMLSGGLNTSGGGGGGSLASVHRGIKSPALHSTGGLQSPTGPSSTLRPVSRHQFSVGGVGGSGGLLPDTPTSKTTGDFSWALTTMQTPSQGGVGHSAAAPGVGAFNLGARPMLALRRTPTPDVHAMLAAGFAGTATPDPGVIAANQAVHANAAATEASQPRIHATFREAPANGMTPMPASIASVSTSSGGMGSLLSSSSSTPVIDSGRSSSTTTADSNGQPSSTTQAAAAAHSAFITSRGNGTGEEPVSGRKRGAADVGLAPAAALNAAGAEPRRRTSE